jgi:Fe-S protein assembly co-chaperone HscB
MMTSMPSCPFTLLNVDIAFSLSEAILEKQFLKKQKQLHPDQFVDPIQKQAAHHLLQRINGAYALLKNPLTRAKACLESKGVKVDDATLQTPFDLLEETMAWQEALEMAHSAKDRHALYQKAKILTQDVNQAFENAFDQNLSDALSVYIRMKYVYRFLQNTQHTPSPLPL